MFLNIFGTLVGVAIGVAFVWMGIRGFRNYKKKLKAKTCIEKSSKAFAYGGLFGGVPIGVALLIFIICQWT